MSGTGTKRNRRGAPGISGAEGRPAAPSAWRRQPPLTPERSYADLTVDIRARDEIRFQARVPASSSRKCRRCAKHPTPRARADDQRWTPGNEQKLMAVFDQREAARRQLDPAAIN